jgi:hypothetical protein
MAARPTFAFVLFGALLSMGASYSTPNFAVEAPTPEIAQQVGQYAEKYRSEKAKLWLGQEMPQWGVPCPLKVTITMNGSGGATTFAFDRGRILSQDMHIEGSLDRVLASVLPHEITHTVFAYNFRTPVPRWADEGGSVLSEDDLERSRHDQLVRSILRTPGRAIPLRRLFTMTKYPPDVMVLYAEGYSVTNFLVATSGRKTFLDFVAMGMRGDWDGAAKTYYGYKTVEDLEQGWLQFLQNNRQESGQVLASRGTDGDPASRMTVRLTVPPAQPLLDGGKPVYRGQMPDAEPQPTFGTRGPNGRPAFLPEYMPSNSGAPTGIPVSFPPVTPPAGLAPSGPLVPGIAPAGPPAPAKLGVPLIEVSPSPAAPPQLGQPFVLPSSPVGYPH